MISSSFQTTAPIQFACAAVEDVSAAQNLSAFERLASIAEEYAERHQWSPLSEILGVQNARRFFRAIGVDYLDPRLGLVSGQVFRETEGSEQ